MKHILLNNLESNNSLVIEFGQFMPYYKRKTFIKKLHKKCDLETSSRFFLFFLIGEQPSRGMELQEKEAHKVKAYKNLFRKKLQLKDAC